jgi:predicted secreted protein
MTLLNALFIYLLLWWLTLFMVLPLGVKPHAEEGRGHQAGAPIRADLKKKLIINTLLSAAILAVIYLLVRFDVIRWHDWFDTEGWR